jgi:hypothetical protein
VLISIKFYTPMIFLNNYIECMLWNVLKSMENFHTYLILFQLLKKIGLFYWNQVNSKQWIVQCWLEVEILNIFYYTIHLEILWMTMYWWLWEFNIILKIEV